MVGAVLVYKGRIIGEGYHQKFGGPHAEVNCLNAVRDEDKSFIREAVLYVSLEPCAHHGKTPPCTDLIIKYKIPKVIIGCRDPFDAVNGKGIEKLTRAGVQVELVSGAWKKKCMEINKRFFCYHMNKRPWIILKWAETKNGFMAGTANNQRLLISNEFSDRLVHKWRSEEVAILVGTNTALKDNPLLTNRLWPGPSPLRLVLDLDLKLPLSLKIFNEEITTIVFNTVKHSIPNEVKMPELKNANKNFYYKVNRDMSIPSQIAKALYDLRVLSVLVEGGAALLQSFMDENLWDEARVISGKEIFVQDGLKSPGLKNADAEKNVRLYSDDISFYSNKMIPALING
jgi:diaminohydroxyphosphoribosylaminopyrimidine deaminase/5-amino-6-(5-phosphoribosylamino)uracil reductase